MDNVKHVEAQVYIADTSVLSDPILFNKMLEKVPAYRQEKVKACQEPKERNLSLAAGVLLNHALRKNGYDEKDFEVEYNEYGKPYFPNHLEITFSLAHSGERAICAMLISAQPVGGEIGCDVEERTIEQVEYLQQNNFTLEQWTKLESYAKATQTELDDLFFGKARITPGFIFTCPDVEEQYSYTVCCRSKIPGENIHVIDLKEIKI